MTTDASAAIPKPSTALAIYSLWKREIVRFVRDRSRVFSSLGQPIVFWILFAAALKNVTFSAPDAGLAEDYGEFFFVGALTMIVLFTSIFSTITVIEDRMQGFLQGVLVSPVPRYAIALSKIFGGVTLAVAQSLLFVCLAPFAGLDISEINYLGILAALILISFALTGLGFSIAWLMDSTAGYHGVMMMFLLPMWLLSGSMFPMQGAHHVLAAIMALNPLTYGVAALRYCFYDAGAMEVRGLPSPLLAWAVIAIFGAVTLGLGTYVVGRRRSRDAT